MIFVRDQGMMILEAINAGRSPLTTTSSSSSLSSSTSTLPPMSLSSSPPLTNMPTNPQTHLQSMSQPISHDPLGAAMSGLQSTIPSSATSSTTSSASALAETASPSLMTSVTPPTQPISATISSEIQRSLAPPKSPSSRRRRGSGDEIATIQSPPESLDDISTLVHYMMREYVSSYNNYMQSYETYIRASTSWPHPDRGEWENTNSGRHSSHGDDNMDKSFTHPPSIMCPSRMDLYLAVEEAVSAHFGSMLQSACGLAYPNWRCKSLFQPTHLNEVNDVPASSTGNNNNSSKFTTNTMNGSGLRGWGNDGVSHLMLPSTAYEDGLLWSEDEYNVCTYKKRDSEATKDLTRRRVTPLTTSSSTLHHSPNPDQSPLHVPPYAAFALYCQYRLQSVIQRPGPSTSHATSSLYDQLNRPITANRMPISSSTSQLPSNNGTTNLPLDMTQTSPQKRPREDTSDQLMSTDTSATKRRRIQTSTLVSEATLSQAEWVVVGRAGSEPTTTYSSETTPQVLRNENLVSNADTIPNTSPVASSSQQPPSASTASSSSFSMDTTRIYRPDLFRTSASVLHYYRVCLYL